MDNPLDSFFPFDPYLLTLSSSYIIPLFREYDGTAIDEKANNIDLEEEKYYEENCDKEDMASSWSTNPGQSPTSTLDFMMYGTSPGFTSM